MKLTGNNTQYYGITPSSDSTVAPRNILNTNDISGIGSGFGGGGRGGFGNSNSIENAVDAIGDAGHEAINLLKDIIHEAAKSANETPVPDEGPEKVGGREGEISIQ